MAHSKRNTSLAFFTAHERSQLKATWGSQATRLTRDSLLPFGSCTLCLLFAKNPVSCCGGPRPAPATSSKDAKSSRQQVHLFCRECAVHNLVAQKKELKRQQRDREAQTAEALDASSRENAEIQARTVNDFERLQNGLDVKSSRLIHGNSESVRKANSPDVGSTENRRKRKFALDVTDINQAADADKDRVRKALQQEKAEESKKRLPSFWIPSLTPDQGRGASSVHDETRKKQASICPGSTPDTQHPFSLKTLVEVHFSYDEQGGKDSSPICPACNRTLTNASKATLAKPCGHVVCGLCVDKFIVGNEGDVVTDVFKAVEKKQKRIQCFVCSTDITTSTTKKDKTKDGKDTIQTGLADISSDGTGFAGGGTNMVQRGGTAFQC